MANYLDLTGLTKYDELIKALIKSGDDELIANPLEAASFLNTNHIYNKCTICQFDSSDKTSIYIAGKR